MPTDDKPAFTPVPDGPGEWTHLEIFGHRTHDGRISEVEKFGGKLARIEVWCRDGHLICAAEYGGAAIFSNTALPGGEPEARRRTGVYACPHPSHADEKANRYTALPSHDDDEEFEPGPDDELDTDGIPG